jgi:hypothetical protein
VHFSEIFRNNDTYCCAESEKHSTQIDFDNDDCKYNIPMPISIYLAREDNTTQQQKIKEMGK